MLNVRTHAVYSDKFTLSVVQLNKTEYATEEDKAYGIDYWAKIFKAKTWEELKMLAENNEYMEETVEALYVANADEIVRQQCRAREDAERRERTLERDNKILKEREQRNLEAMVDLCKELGLDLEDTVNKIAEKYEVNPREIRLKIEACWRK